VIFARDDCIGIGTNDEWNALYALNMDIITQLPLTVNGVHFGFVDFGNVALSRLALTYMTAEIITTLQGWGWYGNTYCFPDTGITQAVSDFHTNGRNDTTKILVIFSATAPYDADLFISAAKAAKSQNIIIAVVGADKADQQVLQQVASSTNLYWFGNTFSNIASSVSNIVNAICTAH